MKISIITLTASSVMNKGFCLKHCIQSILNQKEVNFNDIEMVIIENSRNKSLEYEKLLMDYVKNLDTKGMEIKVIHCEKFSSRGAGRNLGVENSSGELLVFIDEDTMIYSEDGLKQLIEAAKVSDYGYGANRYWTKPENWFEQNSDMILEKMKENVDIFINNISYAPEYIRGSSDTKLQNVSFISNFGYCNKKIFEKVGGYPDFPGRDLEDDFLTFKLFRLGYKYEILYTVSVIHVTHPFENGEDSNIAMYYEMMKKMGYFWFNISKTFEETSPERTDVLQPLNVYHPDYRVMEAYEEYQSLIPANISPADSVEVEIWKKKNKYGIIDFVQLTNKIILAKNIDDLVKGSNSDFDNLIPVILSIVNKKIIEIRSDGGIVDKIDFKYFPPNEYPNKDVVNDPNADYNQFPCDVASRVRRVSLFKERYPLADYLRIGILGDDDLLASEVAKESWIEAHVYEVDQKILDKYDTSWKNITVKNLDFREKDCNITSNLELLQTFIVDPPYTLNGILLFVYKGLQLLKKDGDFYEFYVIINPTMIGSYMLNLQQELSDCNVWIHEVIPNFSQYILPKDFKERSRADDFLKKIGVDPNSLQYSSSSNLYVMRTQYPDLEKLWSKIDINKIYSHFI